MVFSSRVAAALLIAALPLAVAMPSKVEAAEQSEKRQAAIDALLSESLVQPKVRLTTSDVRVRELIGRFRLGESERLDEALLLFIERHREAFGIARPRTELLTLKTEEAGDGGRVTFQQLYEGIPVWGRTLEMDVNPDGELVVAVSRIAPVGEMKTEPSVSGLSAVRTVRAHWEKSRKDEMPPCAKELVIYKGVLAYNVRVPDEQAVFNFFVDAEDGRLLDVERAERDPSGGCH